ncbi:MAG: gliding motility lipoprotein GldK, partial [Alphaproteobacteria bacterium]
MSKSAFSKSLQFALMVGMGVIVAGCGLLGIGGKKGGGDANGELVGQSILERRERMVMTVPYGMVPIPAGTFHMGQADEDPASTQI